MLLRFDFGDKKDLEFLKNIIETMDISIVILFKNNGYFLNYDSLVQLLDDFPTITETIALNILS